MFVTTTMAIEGYQVLEYRGIARGLIVRSPTIVQGFLGGLKNIIGGQMGSFTSMCDKTRAQAYELMVQHAGSMGANAIIGMHYGAAEVAARYSATEVICYGTAVIVQRILSKSS